MKVVVRSRRVLKHNPVNVTSSSIWGFCVTKRVSDMPEAALPTAATIQDAEPNSQATIPHQTLSKSLFLTCPVHILPYIQRISFICPCPSVWNYTCLEFSFFLSCLPPKPPASPAVFFSSAKPERLEGRLDEQTSQNLLHQFLQRCTEQNWKDYINNNQKCPSRSPWTTVPLGLRMDEKAELSQRWTGKGANICLAWGLLIRCSVMFSLHGTDWVSHAHRLSLMTMYRKCQAYIY